MNSTLSNEQRKRRAAIVLPLLVLPFAALLFSVLGGGKTGQAKAAGLTEKRLKTDLPDVNLKNEGLDKMSYYDQARTDSLKRVELMRNDPYYQPGSQPADVNSGQFPGGIYGGGFSGGGNMRRQEAMIYDKINDINLSMGQNYPGASAQPFSSGPKTTGVMSEDLDRLEQMMSMMQGQQQPDREVMELGNLLKSIQEIQNPELVRQRLRDQSAKNKGQVFSVKTNRTSDIVSVLETEKRPSSGNGFYGLEETAEQNPGTAVRAVVHESQVLTEGARVKFRLKDDVFINGTFIPKDNFIHGTASLQGERLEVEIDQIQFRGALLPVKLTVYDLDGLPGIHIPGAIARDVAKQSGTDAIQGVGLSTLDPSLAAQAATAGVELTKTLLSKKMKLVKVTVKAGYQVLLKDENQKQ
ncbi:hypothetical protein ABIE26_002943 [Pedobacter africanus]|uniref:conjugative transposon protein TraM n=1 Tax=Pedobacter africanus TaxID=151894 RepID=UPI0033970468